MPARPRRLYLKSYSRREVQLRPPHLQALPSYAPSLSQPTRFTIELAATSAPLCIHHPDEGDYWTRQRRFFGSQEFTKLQAICRPKALATVFAPVSERSYHAESLRSHFPRSFSMSGTFATASSPCARRNPSQQTVEVRSCPIFPRLTTQRHETVFMGNFADRAHVLAPAARTLTRVRMVWTICLCLCVV